MIPLEDLVRWVGAAVAFFGALLAAPGATKFLVQRAATGLRGLLRRPGRVRIAAGGASATVSFSATARGAWDMKVWGISARLQRVEQRLLQLRGQIEQQEDRLNFEISERKRAMIKAQEDFQRETSELAHRIDVMERENIEVEATALPAIGLGILLGGINDLLAVSPFLGIPAIALAVLALALAAGKHADRRREEAQGREPEPSSS